VGVSRALHANIETDPDRHGSRPRQVLLEPWEQLAESALAAEQQRMHVPRLRRPHAVRGLRGQSVALQNEHLLETIGEAPAAASPPMPAPITTACLAIRVDATATSLLPATPSKGAAAIISLCADATKQRNVGPYVGAESDGQRSP
jgi:hypothetical protein